MAGYERSPAVSPHDGAAPKRDPAPWRLRPSTADDAAWIAELRAEVMRPDLERLGRFDPDRVRQRFLNAFVPEFTSVIEASGAGEAVGASELPGAPASPESPAPDEDRTHVALGVIAVRPEPDALWIEHFYLAPSQQGRGLGSAVLQHVMREHADERPFRLDVLQGSPARRLYERHGFEFEREDEVDVFLVRAPDVNMLR
ncbi:GNAT family N-acetyltransferase [Subtercola vilae]|uniref:N-acetyltransferase n=1 Tax=Subtercola vilae TaxID=2056433 RepID=A0A4T2C7D3_9MICO|nr:GNAT family N-acetyltransferase [Subtercola vilae]TIH40050.1 N-acetyltransferase [Subtercola vilae]